MTKSGSWRAVERLLRSTRCVALRPRPGAALLRLPPVGGVDIDGSLSQISRQTFVQVGAFASHARGGVCPAMPIRELGYLMRLRSHGLDVQWPVLGLSDATGWDLVIDGRADEGGDALASSSSSARHWRLRFDFRPGLSLAPNEFVLPYTMNPTILIRGADRRLRVDLDGNRRMRILFAGSWQRDHYDRAELITDLFGKATRFELVSRFAEWPSGLHRAEGRDWLARLPGDAQVVLADTAVARVPFDEWLGTIHSSDFLLCPPGCIMPLCYNIVEAMAGGTVPITNYGDWLTPPLEHGVNCLAFRTPGELHACLEEAREMPQAAVHGMRHAARAYYLAHLDQAATFRRLHALGTAPLVLHAVDETLARVRTMAAGAG